MMLARGLSLLAIAPLLGCTVPLDLPPLARTGQPLVRSIEPDIALVSARTPVCVRGEGLSTVEEVRVGEFVLPRHAFTVVDDTMLELRVPLEAVQAARSGASTLGETEGRRRTVQVRGPGGESSASDALRLFDAPAEVESVTPRSAAPGQVVFLRGRGFDAETMLNNAIMLVGSPDQLQAALDATASLGDQSAAVSSDFAALAGASQSTEEAGFAVAQTLLATPTTLVVMLPPAAPAGGVTFEYMNLALQKVSGPTGCRPSDDDQTSTTGADETPDPRLGQVAEGLKVLRVWRPLTALSVRASALGRDVAEVEAPERLCYLDAGSSVDEELRVFLDGRAVSHRASDPLHVACRPDDRDRLLLYGVEPGRHLLQVANPFGLSPTVGFEL
jgi:hypothetical protein